MGKKVEECLEDMDDINGDGYSAKLGSNRRRPCN